MTGVQTCALPIYGNLFIGHWGEGLTIFNTKTETIKYFKNNKSDKKSLPGNEIINIFIDSNDIVWFGTHQGLATYNYDTEDFNVYKSSKDNPHSINVDDTHLISQIDNEIWVGSWRGGINIIDLDDFDQRQPEKQKFRHIHSKCGNQSISNSSIVDITKDSFGNIWIATFGSGVNIISHIPPYFKSIAKEKNIDNLNITNEIVTSLSVDKYNNLLVGMANATIDILDANGNKFSLTNLNAGIPNSNILNSLTDSEGDFWIGADGAGLMRYDKNLRKFIIVDNSDEMKKHDYVTALFCDKNDLIWIGSNCGLGYYDKKNKTYTDIDLKRYGLKDAFVKSICRDDKGYIWIGTGNDGILIFDSNNELKNRFSNKEGFITNNIMHLAKDNNGRIWAGTFFGMICFNYVDNNNLTYTIYSRGNNLNDDCVKAICPGTDNEIWVSTNSGISKFIIDKKRFVNYNYNNGIISGTFNPGVVTKDSNGIIYFGAQTGICYFDSNISNNEIEIPKVKIISVSLYDKTGYKSVIKENLPIKSKYNLDYYDNTFRIDFNLMDYALKGQADYIYTLKGYEDLWHETDQNNVIFQNLPYGKYIFAVKAKLKYNVWGHEETYIEIVVNPPFWLTWWAKLIYVIISILILVLIIRGYKHRLDLKNIHYLEKQQYIQAQQLNEERINFFTNITHELRTPLTLILGPLEEIDSDKVDVSNLKSNISLIRNNALRLYSLINRILEFRKCETLNKNLKVEYLDIHAFISSESKKFIEGNKKKDISIRLESEIKESFIFFDPGIVSTIIDNLTSNAIRYTEKGEIVLCIRFSEDQKDIIISVKDTGIGIPNDCIDHIFENYYQAKNNNINNGTGIGLALVKRLVTLHKAKIEVRSEINVGSEFLFFLPTSNIYSSDEIVDIQENGVKNDILSNEVDKSSLEQEVSDKMIPDNSVSNSMEKNSNESDNKTKPIMLIVEDNNELRNFIINTFINDYKILSAADGKCGVELAFENLPDIIISDVMMPVMDGVEMCRLIKEEIKTCHIPVILLTAKDSVMAKNEGYDNGADSYITKPFSISLLKTRVENLLSGRKKIMSYYNSGEFKKSIITSSLNKKESGFMNDVNEFILKNISSEDLSISFMADNFNMSYSSFSRKVKSITGLTVNEIIRKLRMKRAEDLLMSGDKSIAEISETVGYNSVAAFREAFKTEFGESPSNYINKIKSNI